MAAVSCRGISKNLHFKSFQASLGTIDVTNAILDGGIIVLGKDGTSQFNSLLSRKNEEVAVFYAFDLIWVNGWDLRQSPLMERKARLRALVSNLVLNWLNGKNNRASVRWRHHP